MRKLRITWIAAAMAAAVLALAGVAVAANDAPSRVATPGGPVGINCGVTDPDALAELQALRTDFFEARQAWFDKYGDDRMSGDAQTALQKLRDDRVMKTQAVLDKYGIDAKAGAHAGEGGGHGYGRMMGGGMGRGMGGGMGACGAGDAPTT